MKHIFSILSIIILFNINLSAQKMQKVSEQQRKTMIETIEKKSSDIKTIKCNFKQVKNVSFLNDKVVSEGKMLFSNGKLRWEYATPYKYIFIVNNQQIFIKSGEKTQKIDAQSSQLFKNIAQLMVNSVTGMNLTANNEFDVQMFTQNDTWIAKLYPKQAKMKKFFTEITLFFNSNKSMVYKVEMKEPSGDTTIINLTDVKTNEKIDNSNFVLP